MSRQEEPRKTCSCGRGTIYTAPHMRKRNLVLDGKQVCVECKMDAFYNDFCRRIALTDDDQ